MHTFSQYWVFLAETITVVFAILVIAFGLMVLFSKNKSSDRSRIEIKKLNDCYDDLRDQLQENVLDKKEFKRYIKDEKKREKEAAHEKTERKRLFVIKFDGDMKASAVTHLREEITAVLTIATPKDEVAVLIETGGGFTHAYGLASSQLQRLRDRHIPLTTIIDKIGASGGYMMACVGNRILAAPFAIVGSIGVVGQLPNFHRWLKKNDIDYELETAGEYKRTLTMLGENTDKAREKFRAEIEDVHVLFKQFVSLHRPQVNIKEIATGEHWFGQRALEKNLVDELTTSDDYLFAQSKIADLYLIRHQSKKSLSERLFSASTQMLSRVFGGAKGFF